MFKHILLPIGSELSMRAADTGIELARRLGARVYACHVVAPFPAIIPFGELIQANEATYTREAVAVAERYLAEVRRRADATGVAFGGSYQIDKRPHCAIVAAAEREHCDLIVMGSHVARLRPAAAGQRDAQGDPRQCVAGAGMPLNRTLRPSGGRRMGMEAA
jgi:nucleotide-binding universal stress UspA family protein